MTTPRPGPLAAACLGPALLAAALTAWGTSRGIAVTDDSVVYLDAAAHLAAGDGLVAQPIGAMGLRPLVRFPPAYPALLSFGPRLGIDLLAFARIAHVALAFANALVIAGIAAAATRRTLPAAIAGALGAVSLGYLEANTAAWSEPLFMPLVLLGQAALARALRDDDRRALVLAAMLIGASCLVRYMGAVGVASGALACLLWGHPPVRRRLGRATLFGLIAAAPMVVFMLRNRSASGSATGRSVSVMMPTLDHLRALVQVVGSWIAPGTDRVHVVPGQEALVAAIVVLAGAGCQLAWRRSAAAVRAADQVLPRVLVLYGGVYLAAFATSLTFVVHTSPIDARLMLPVYGSLLVAGVVQLSAAPPAAHPRVRWALRGLVAGLVLVGLAASTTAATVLHRRGRGYLADDWRLGAIARRVRALPADVFAYSNQPAALLLQTGHAVAWWPRDDRERAELLQRLAERRAVIVNFHASRKFAPHGQAAAMVVGHDAPRFEDLAPTLPIARTVNDGTADLYEPAPPR